jgi:hypothetical protein
VFKEGEAHHAIVCAFVFEEGSGAEGRVAGVGAVCAGGVEDFVYTARALVTRKDIWERGGSLQRRVVTWAQSTSLDQQPRPRVGVIGVQEVEDFC